VFLAVAIHHAAPDHVHDLLDHMNRVAENVKGASGLLEFQCLRESDGTRLIGFSRWDSQAAFEAALPRIGQFRDQRQPEWSTQPDELLMLTPV
jgi:heme-degrading monooxygenase HmoA